MSAPVKPTFPPKKAEPMDPAGTDDAGQGAPPSGIMALLLQLRDMLTAPGVLPAVTPAAPSDGGGDMPPELLAAMAKLKGGAPPPAAAAATKSTGGY